MTDTDDDKVEEVKKLPEESKVITEKLDEKSIDITYSNINEFRNYIKFIMTVSFTVIPITITCLSFILANEIEFEASLLYFIGTGLIICLLTIILAFFGGLPEIKPITSEQLEELEVILMKKLIWLMISALGLLMQLFTIGLGLILMVL